MPTPVMFASSPALELVAPSDCQMREIWSRLPVKMTCMRFWGSLSVRAPRSVRMTCPVDGVPPPVRNRSTDQKASVPDVRGRPLRSRPVVLAFTRMTGSIQSARLPFCHSPAVSTPKKISISMSWPPTSDLAPIVRGPSVSGQHSTGWRALMNRSSAESCGRLPASILRVSPEGWMET